MYGDFVNSLYQRHSNREHFPSSGSIKEFTDLTLRLLFPEICEKEYHSLNALDKDFAALETSLFVMLTIMKDRLRKMPSVLVSQFADQLPVIYDILLKDIQAIMFGDPAAQDQYEVVRTYPGFYAIAMHRLAHLLCELQVPLIPRVISEHAHAETGIDIHPKAEIGPYFCIDHGTGIVIGETTQIGRNVKIYQGVTLGALSVSKDMANTKRHPTIEEKVVIYSGATILGGSTVIGANSIIGGNVWLTKSVPEYSRVYNKAFIEVKNDRVSHVPEQSRL